MKVADELSAVARHTTQRAQILQRQVKSLAQTARILWRHPLTRDQRARALHRWLSWQLSSRLSPGARIVPFVDPLRLIVHRGMYSATAALYVGLEEFEDMSFVLHLLRPGDHVLDVGANVGIYSLLAARAGATVQAFEPIPQAYAVLRDHIVLNHLEDQIQAHPVALGEAPAQIQFTQNLSTTNHALAAGETAEDPIDCPVYPLDDWAHAPPRLLKIDVEGFEMPVLRGAQQTLTHPDLWAILIELNGSGARYGYEDPQIDGELRRFGFRPYAYDPRTRLLSPLHRHRSRGNTLYLRPEAPVAQRVAEAPAYTLRGQPV